jgi:hypothetical protein
MRDFLPGGIEAILLETGAALDDDIWNHAAVHQLPLDRVLGSPVCIMG